jgi:phage terminase small subunit
MAKKKSRESYALDLSLTDKEEAACRQYVVRLSIQDAADAAGVTYQGASAMLNRPACRSFIKSLVYERNTRTKVDADVLLLQLQKMMNADFSEIMDPSGVEFLPLTEWPLIWRQMINGRKVDKDGNVSYTFMDRAKVLEMIGKHTDVGAWVERVVHEVGLADRLAAARMRHLDMMALQEDRMKVIPGVIIDMAEKVNVSQEEARSITDEREG